MQRRAIFHAELPTCAPDFRTKNMAYSTQTRALLLTVCASAALAVPVDVKPCDGLDNIAVSMSEIDIENVVLGETMVIKYRVMTSEMLKNPVLDFRLDTAGFNLPCNPQTSFGSCEYSLCGKQRFDVEQDMCKAWDCVCPMKPGTYLNKDGIKFKMPEFAGLIGAVIVESETILTLRIKDGGKTHFCGTFTTRVKSNKKNGLPGIFGRNNCLNVDMNRDNKVINETQSD